MEDNLLFDMAQSVSSREELVGFIAHLAGSAVEDGWENKKLADYLDALAGWLADCEAFYRNTGSKVDSSKPQWRVFAEALLAASVYE